VAPGHQQGQRQLGLLAARQQRRVLVHLVAGQPERAQQAPPHLLGLAGGGLGHVLQQRPPGRDALVLLGVVPDGDLVAEVHDPGVGDRLAGQDAQQRRLTGAVEAQHQQPLASAHVERHVLEHGRAVAVRLGQARHR
jgi:hypothetical protein